MTVSVDEIICETDSQIRFHEFVKEFYGAPQGDICIIRVPNLESGRQALSQILKEEFGSSFQLAEIGPKTNNLQLVQGDSIGSRHCIRPEDSSVVTIFAPDPQNASLLEGPAIYATSRFVVTHPEHAWHSFPEGSYQVVYSRDIAFEELRATQD